MPGRGGEFLAHQGRNDRLIHISPKPQGGRKRHAWQWLSGLQVRVHAGTLRSESLSSPPLTSSQMNSTIERGFFFFPLGTSRVLRTTKLSGKCPTPAGLSGPVSRRCKRIPNTLISQGNTVFLLLQVSSLSSRNYKQNTVRPVPTGRENADVLMANSPWTQPLLHCTADSYSCATFACVTFCSAWTRQSRSLRFLQNSTLCLWTWSSVLRIKTLGSPSTRPASVKSSHSVPGAAE